ncbi:MAG: hypothetical protein M1822_008412 [Bathelium mastoideum]|nr:MAG: hypothetical protein M1822_008412 [Bathelium mastoideum]
MNGNTVTRVGAGRDWGDVYSVLDHQNLTVIGGREKSVGVAGLTLGGGISYFSGLYGLACDNVINYEVILADGTVAQVNSSSPYEEIYRVLRGGGNNFGIVTRFDLTTYTYHLIRGGLTVWSSDNQTTSALIAAYANFTNNAASSPSTAIFLAQGFNSATNSFIWSAGLYDTAPDLTTNSSAPIFAPFATSELNSARLLTTERLTNHSDLASELDSTQPPNLRNQFTTATYVMSPTLMQQMVNIYREEVLSAVRANVSSDPAFSPNLAFQPLTQNMLQYQNRRGGNVLGLQLGAKGFSNDERPLMLMSFTWQWSDAAYDTVVRAHIANILDRSTQAAESLGLLNEWIYMNYAAPTQQPIASYGEANREFMERVQNQWDPDGVFQHLVPGGFKVVQGSGPFP